MREERREAESGRMRVPAVSCPRCGSTPALRVSEPLIERVEDLPPEERVASYRCQRRGCGEIYPIPAGACQQARPPRPGTPEGA